MKDVSSSAARLYRRASLASMKSSCFTSLQYLPKSRNNGKVIGKTSVSTLLLRCCGVVLDLDALPSGLRWFSANRWAASPRPRHARRTSKVCTSTNIFDDQK